MKKKLLYSVVVNIMCVGVIYAQPCDCEKIKMSFYKTPSTEAKVNEVLGAYNRFFERPPIIQALPYACAGYYIYALICENKERYIFYDTPFMNKVVAGKIDGSEDFLIAHEIAHHVIGHTFETYTLGKNASKADKVTNVVYKRYRVALKINNIKAQTIQLSRSQIKELEADALAAWMVSQKMEKKVSAEAIFNNIIKAYESMSHQQINQYEWDASYPSFILRKLIAKEIIESIYQSSNNKYKDIVVNPSIRNELQKEVINYYHFYIATAPDSSQLRFTETERTLWNEYNRSIYVEPVVGLQVQFPTFKREGSFVPASVAKGMTAGLRIGIGQWEKKGRFEADILWSANNFKTQTQVEDQFKDVENFTFQQFIIQPRYVIGNFKAKGSYRASGMQVGGGPSFQIPFALNYETNVTVAPAIPTLRRSIGVMGGVGYWWGHYRVWGSYSLQPLRFAESDVQKIQAIQHCVRIDASFRF